MNDRYLKARVAFIQLADAAQSKGAKAFWNKRLKWCEKKIIQARKREMEQERRMGKLKLLIIIINVAVILSIFCSGCNTVSGFGRDVTAVSDGFREQMAKGK